MFVLTETYVLVLLQRSTFALFVSLYDHKLPKKIIALDSHVWKYVIVNIDKTSELISNVIFAKSYIFILYCFC